MAGGVGSVATGGKFWQGAAVGLMNAGLNHVEQGLNQKMLTTWDKNGDGKLSKREADAWWLYGNTDEITVDGNLIDLKGFNLNNTSYSTKYDIYSYDTVDAFIDLPWETASTYGGSNFKMVNGSPQMQSQLYHYNMRPNNSMGNILRNAATILGRPHIPRGVTPRDYLINIQYYTP